MAEQNMMISWTRVGSQRCHLMRCNHNVNANTDADFVHSTSQQDPWDAAQFSEIMNNVK